MPQPALHLILAHGTLQQWQPLADAPFDVTDDACRNAFLLGSLGPDLGLFPGGDATVSRLAHTQRTASLVRTLVGSARTEVEAAFAWGWLSHFVADISVHPLVNAAAAEYALADGGRTATLLDHVRVEVGLDAWYAWHHPVLRRMRLLPVFDRHSAAFLRSAFDVTWRYSVATPQILQMQRGMLRFTHLALHFATTVARDVCWADAAGHEAAPLTSTAVWRLVTMLSARRSTVHAYLNPARPDTGLLTAVDNAVCAYHESLKDWLRAGLHHLPDYDLETGALIEDARSAA